MRPTPEARYRELSDWLSARTLQGWDIPTLQSELVARLQSFGMPFNRMHIGLPMLHPLFSVGTYTWSPDAGVRVDTFLRGMSTQQAWLDSPIRPFYEDGSEEGRLRIVEGSGFDRFPMLQAAARHGASDYFVQLTNFPDRTVPVDRQEGIVLTWISSAPDGFSDDDLTLLRLLRLPLCAHLKHLTHRRLVDDILDAYLGGYSGKRVHDGQIQRGDGDVIEAVVLFCDLRGSSQHAETHDLHGFLALLNEYYEVTAGAVLASGGEVLRYIGDASLAIFPLDRYRDRREACQAALDAALIAVRRGEALNGQRNERGERPIEFGIGLHVGTVLYGNIGTRERIEFTVVGQAANEAARVEAECKTLDETILVTDTFAQSLPREWRSHGEFQLRNIGRPIEILSPTAE